MIPTTITLTLDHQTLEAINRLISALEKANPAPAVPAQPTAQVNPTTPVPGAPLSATSAQPEVPVASPVPVNNIAPVQPVAPTTTPQPAAESQQTATIPTSHVAQAYTVEQLQTAMAALVDAGKMDGVRALLGSFGVQSVMALQPDQYGALATALRGMGAQI